MASAFAASQRGDDATAIDLILPMLPDRERMGGSRAQIDLVEATLLRAYLNAGREAEARRSFQSRDSNKVLSNEHPTAIARHALCRHRVSRIRRIQTLPTTAPATRTLKAVL